jgi:hypothetical protein
MIRTCDHLIRSQVLYPAELRVLKEVRIIYKSAIFQSSFFALVDNFPVRLCSC